MVLVLIIAWANRGETPDGPYPPRRGEISIRLALGGSRSRIVR